jgi:hypothetical protein
VLGRKLGDAAQLMMSKRVCSVAVLVCAIVIAGATAQSAAAESASQDVFERCFEMYRLWTR